MKAKDLQVGDIVMIDNHPRKIEQLTKRKVGYHLKPNEPRMHYERLHHVSPVIITADFLQQNGFMKHFSRETFHDEYVRLGKDRERFNDEIVTVCLWDIGTLIKVNHQFKGYVKNIHTPMCPYIHQLQRACAIGEIEIDWNIEGISNTRKVYRFEHATNKDLGLWYMRDGSDSGYIHKLNLSSKEMPMGRDDSHYVAPSGNRYHCSAPDRETLLHWFSNDDYPILRDNDFVLIEYVVSEFKEDGPQTLFTREGVLSRKQIPYNEW